MVPLTSQSWISYQIYSTRHMFSIVEWVINLISAKSVIAHLKLLVRGVLQIHKTIQALAFAFGFPAVTV